ncbi:MAG TPA: MurR/RpiR family transcriptional regulator [Trueperaceae bacterium]|nr:MurR/RpiR family transcriptional regulator [Trueperaceae bacterium]
MPPLDLVTRIRDARPLPTTQERVARYLEVSYAAVPFHTADQIALAAGASKATVVRFVRRLGYEGIHELRAQLRNALYGIGDSPASRFDRRQEGVDLRTQLNRLGRQEARNIKRTVDLLDVGELQGLCTDLIRADTVWVFGQRFSHGIAFNLGLLLSQLLPRVQTVSGEGGALPDRLGAMRADDHLIIVAHRRVGAVKIALSEYARDRGTPYSVLTDLQDDVGGLVANAAHALRSVTDTAGAFNSYAASLVLAHAIAAVLERAAPTAPSRLTQAEVALQRFGSFAGEGR